MVLIKTVVPVLTVYRRVRLTQLPNICSSIIPLRPTRFTTWRRKAFLNGYCTVTRNWVDPGNYSHKNSETEANEEIELNNNWNCRFGGFEFGVNNPFSTVNFSELSQDAARISTASRLEENLNLRTENRIMKWAERNAAVGVFDNVRVST